MSEQISDGSGKGYLAKVDSENRLFTYSKSASIQHVISDGDENAYQVVGSATLSSGTVTVLHITNDDTDKNMIVTYIRHQVIGATGGTAFPNSSNYFTIRLTRTYSSGGSAVVPVNVFSGSGKTAKVSCYDSGPTLAGTGLEIDRWYTKSDGDMNTFSKEGALIIPPNKTMEVSYIGDMTGGVIYARISFIMGA
jgi:hypothetical protein